MVRSSLPLSSPLMTTDFPMFTVVLSIPRSGSLVVLGGIRESAATGALDGAAEPDPGLAGAPGLTASSRFHIGHSPRVRKLTLAGCLVLERLGQRPVSIRR